VSLTQTDIIKNATKFVENETKEGFDEDSGKWYAHASPEGGLATIGYGNKGQSRDEVAQWGTQGISDEGINAMFDSAWDSASSTAARQYNAAYEDSFDDLSELGKALLTEVAFNTGSVNNSSGNFGWPNLVEAIKNDDVDGMKREINRTYTTPEGEVVSLERRVGFLGDAIDEAVELSNASSAGEGEDVGTIEAVPDSLMKRISRFISESIPGNQADRNRRYQTVNDLLGFTPLVAEESFNEASEEFEDGDVGSGLLSAAIGAADVFPGAAVATKATKAGTKAVKDKVKDYDLSNSQKTQVATTGGTYQKARALLDEMGIGDDVIDYGAGRGHGTSILRGESYEPYPQGGFIPTYTSSPDRTYDGVVNLNVLNVLPEPTRSQVAREILERINEGGKGIVGARSYPDVMSAKNPEILDDGGIMTSRGTYQYGFGGKNESLVDYLTRIAEDIPEKQFEITKAPIAATGAVINRIKKPIELNKGGLVSASCSCGKGAACDCGSKNKKDKYYHGGSVGMMTPTLELIVGMDEESGNPIPAGSTAKEVRDDVEAMLSEGEYVLPADVVKWHGLKHIQEMRQEAKAGLMCMTMEGQIKTPEEDYEEAEDYEEESEDVEVTEEGNEIEVVDNTKEKKIKAADGGLVETEETTPLGYLIRRLVRGPDGRMVVRYFDPETGMYVSDPTGYEVLDQNPQNALANAGVPVVEADEDTVAEEIIEDTGSSSSSSSDNDRPITSAAPRIERNQFNNYGFEDPNKLATMGGTLIGGPLVGGLMKFGQGFNNAEAVDAAREDLGMEGLGFFDKLKGGFTGKYNTGEIGEGEINDYNYTVGFGGRVLEDDDGVQTTTLTPAEYMRRKDSQNIDISKLPSATKSESSGIMSQPVVTSEPVVTPDYFNDEGEGFDDSDAVVIGTIPDDTVTGVAPSYIETWNDEEEGFTPLELNSGIDPMADFIEQEKLRNGIFEEQVLRDGLQPKSEAATPERLVDKPNYNTKNKSSNSTKPVGAGKTVKERLKDAEKKYGFLAKGGR
tara:strand:- start:11754 stop:14816 length:3063 start_codon:yes stop_codon:yes gene_type:complete